MTSTTPSSPGLGTASRPGAGAHVGARIAELGVDPAAVEDLLDALEQPGLDPHALVVARHGVPVLRGTWAPYRADVPGLVYSVSKTFTSIAIGHLVAEGRLTVDDLAGQILGLPDPTGITVRHLLTMNTGHTTEQVAAAGFDSASLLAAVPEHAPGTHFVYSSPASMVLSSVVTALTGQPLTAYLRPRVLDPLGIESPWWVPHVDGGLAIEQGFSGLHLTVDDVARLATAMADGGRYDGAQVIPAAWVDAMQRGWSDNADRSADGGTDHDWAQGYGYQVWRSRRGFRADGAYGQFGLAVPDQGLAVGYLGATRTTDRVLDAFWRFAERLSDGPVAAGDDAVARLGRRLAALDTWTPDGARTGPDPETTPPQVISPVPWTLLEAGDAAGDAAGAPGTWRVDVGGHVLDATHDAWRTHVVPWPHGAADGYAVDDPTLVLSVRARTGDDGRAEIHAVVPTSPHRLVARGLPGERLDLAWLTTPLWRPSLTTLAVPRTFPVG